MGWDETLSTSMIHICQAHLLQANQVLWALNIYDCKLLTQPYLWHNHKIFLLSSKDVPASSVSFLFYFTCFITVNEVNLEQRALTSLRMFQFWEDGGGLYTSLQLCISLYPRSSHPCGRIMGKIKGKEISCIFVFTTWLNPSMRFWKESADGQHETESLWEGNQ